MPTGYQITDQYATYYITPTIVDWVDIFSRKIYRDIVIDSLKYCIASKGLLLYGYVIMTNHCHLMVRSSNGALSAVIRDFKKFTARKIIETIKTEPESRREWLLHRFEWNAGQNKRSADNQVWTHENHAIIITSQAFFLQKLDYLHQNPVRTGWVKYEEEYVYSSAYALLHNIDEPLILSRWYD